MTGSTTCRCTAAIPDGARFCPNCGKPVPRSALDMAVAEIKSGSPHHRPAQLIKPAQAADYLGVSVSTLKRWRKEGKGPASIKISPKAVRYSVAAILAYRISE